MPDKSGSPAIYPKIRIGSYNIMASAMTGTDGLAAAIAAMNADIIGLQEVDNQTLRSGRNFSKNGGTPLNQAEYIAGKLGLNYCFCKAMDYDGGEYGTAVLSRYPLKLCKRIELPNTHKNEEPFEPRAACAVAADVPGYPAPMLVVVTHLDHTSSQLRTKQLRALTSGFCEFPGGPLILIGDLNLTPDSNQYEYLMKYFCETDITPTEPSWEPQNKIDYILFSQHWEIQNFYIPKPGDCVSALPYAEISDHLPITATVRLIAG